MSERKQAAEDALRAAASLLASGYEEVTEHGRLAVGQRVKHIGELYSDAGWYGTAALQRIFVRRETDVEVIVLRDKPGMSGLHGQWADYHTEVVHDGWDRIAERDARKAAS